MSIYKLHQRYEICRSRRKALPFSQGFVKMLILKASYIFIGVVMLFQKFIVNKTKLYLQTLCRLN